MPHYFFFDGKLYERMNGQPVYTPPQPGTPEYIGPDFDDQPRKSVVISAAQYDDLRGLVSDLQVLVVEFDAKAAEALKAYAATPLGLPAGHHWQQHGAYAHAADWLRWALKQHPSVAGIK